MTMTTPRVARRLARSPFRCPAVLRRQTAGQRNDYGEFVPGAVVEVDVDVVSVPLSGEERQVLPEGLRERNVRTLWTTETVAAVVEGQTGNSGDHIVFEGATYQVVEVRAWRGWYEAMGVETRPTA